MSDFHSIEEAYQIATEALNYLEENGEDINVPEIPFDDSHVLFEGNAGIVLWNTKTKVWDLSI